MKMNVEIATTKDTKEFLEKIPEDEKHIMEYYEIGSDFVGFMAVRESKLVGFAITTVKGMHNLKRKKLYFQMHNCVNLFRLDLQSANFISTCCTYLRNIASRALERHRKRLDYATENGFNIITMQVNKENKIAIYLYERMGFQFNADQSGFLAYKNFIFYHGSHFLFVYHICC